MTFQPKVNSKTLELNEVGSKFGYCTEPTKFWLVVKPRPTKYVNNVFFGTKIKVTSEGDTYLGQTIGISYFKNIYIWKKNLTNGLVNSNYYQK